MSDKNNKIDKKEIEHIASLAKLDISQESEQFVRDVQIMIEMMEKLSKLDIFTDVSPLDMINIIGMELTNTFREDIAKPSISRELALANAPEVEAGCISVPKTLGVGK